MDTVNRIKADIAALPAEYRALVHAEQTIFAEHPALMTAGLLLAGAVIGIGLAFVI